MQDRGLGQIRRFSAMSVMADIRPAVEAYQGLGCPLHEADDEFCVGVQAGDTYHLLISESLLSRSYPPALVSLLSGRTIPYLWVPDLARALKSFPTTVEILAERSGEILLRLNGILTMLADGTATE